jgi:hypothetical protein
MHYKFSQTLADSETDPPIEVTEDISKVTCKQCLYDIKIGNVDVPTIQPTTSQD